MAEIPVCCFYVSDVMLPNFQSWGEKQGCPVSDPEGLSVLPGSEPDSWLQLPILSHQERQVIDPNSTRLAGVGSWHLLKVHSHWLLCVDCLPSYMYC